MKLFLLTLLFLFFHPQTIIYSQTAIDSAKAKTYLSIGLKWDSFSSKSSSPGGIPLKLNNPVLSAGGAAFSFGYYILARNTVHEFTLDFTFPVKQKFDDGLGNNFIINENESDYLFIELNYHFTGLLFSLGNFNIRWGAAWNLLFEESRLNYLYGAELKRWDITNHPGLVLAADFKLFNSFIMYAKIRPMFTLGILNFGRFSYTNKDNNISEAFNYHSSGFYSIFQAGIKYDLTTNSLIEAGYFRNGNLNLAARQMFPSDYQNSLNKIYRNEGFYINYQLNTEQLW